MNTRLVKIGTLVGGADAVRVIPQIGVHGFESYSLTFWQSTRGLDLRETAKRVNDIVAAQGAVISCLSVYGNPLTGEGENSDTLASWERLIDSAHLFNTDLVTGFTGRLPDMPIDASLPRFKQVFGELIRRAEQNNVRIAFENCAMDGNWNRGDWNIAHNPRAWELMFDALPSERMGLQWEPCHQLLTLIDPLPQLRKWVSRVFNVHGKDATVAWDIVREHGIGGPHSFAWHRTPGFGDTNWSDVITVLLQASYTGTIDIEGWHDPVYRDDLEMTGQVRALRYLKDCRGGDFVRNPL